MRKDKIKSALFGGAIVIVVLFGIEFASSGIEQVHGPLASSTDPTVQVQPEPEALEVPASNEEQPAPIVLGPLQPDPVQSYVENRQSSLAGQGNGEPMVNRVANGTAGLLQSLSSGGIRFVVTLFDAITE